MTVSVHFHGKQRLTAGKEYITLSLGNKSRVSDIIHEIEKSYPDMAFPKDAILITINDKAAGSDTILQDNDVISFMPLFGGG